MTRGRILHVSICQLSHSSLFYCFLSLYGTYTTLSLLPWSFFLCSPSIALSSPLFSRYTVHCRYCSGLALYSVHLSRCRYCSDVALYAVRLAHCRYCSVLDLYSVHLSHCCYCSDVALYAVRLSHSDYSSDLVPYAVRLKSHLSRNDHSYEAVLATTPSVVVF